MQDNGQPSRLILVFPRGRCRSAAGKPWDKDKAEAPRLGSGPAGDASGTASGKRAPPRTPPPQYPRAVQTGRGCSPPDSGVGLGPRRHVPESPRLWEGSGPWPKSVAGRRSPESPSLTAASSPRPQQPTKTPLPGDRHALPAGRGLLVPPAHQESLTRPESPRRCRPRRQALRPRSEHRHRLSPQRNHGYLSRAPGPGSTSFRNRLFRPLPWPPPTALSLLNRRSRLSTPSQRAYPAQPAQTRAPAPSIGRSHLCPVLCACVVFRPPAGKEERNALGIPGPGILGIGQGLEPTPQGQELGLLSLLHRRQRWHGR